MKESTYTVDSSYDSSYYEHNLLDYLENRRFSRTRMNRVMKLADIQSGERCLDLGCGLGTFVIEGSKLGAEMTGMDMSSEALKIAKKIADRHLGENNARFVLGNSSVIPMDESSLDKVICADFFEHLDHDNLWKTLCECFRVLKHGGALIIYCPCPSHIFELLKSRNILLKRDETHIGMRSMNEYLELLPKAGFSVERSFFRPTHLPVFQWLETPIMPLPLIGPLFRRRILIRARKI